MDETARAPEKKPIPTSYHVSKFKPNGRENRDCSLADFAISNIHGLWTDLDRSLVESFGSLQGERCVHGPILASSMHCLGSDELEDPSLPMPALLLPKMSTSPSEGGPLSEPTNDHARKSIDKNSKQTTRHEACAKQHISKPEKEKSKSTSHKHQPSKQPHQEGSPKEAQRAVSGRPRAPSSAASSADSRHHDSLAGGSIPSRAPSGPADAHPAAAGGAEHRDDGRRVRFEKVLAVSIAPAAAPPPAASFAARLYRAVSRRLVRSLRGTGGGG